MEIADGRRTKQMSRRPAKPPAARRGDSSRKAAAVHVLPRRRCVLIVDDDYSIRKLMIALIGDSGYSILEAQNGCEALHLAEENCVDLIVTDREMPGMDGPELITMLRRRGLIERCLLVTGNADGIGPHLRSSLLSKPFSGAQLLGKIQEILAD